MTLPALRSVETVFYWSNRVTRTTFRCRRVAVVMWPSLRICAWINRKCSVVPINSFSSASVKYDRFSSSSTSSSSGIHHWTMMLWCGCVAKSWTTSGVWLQSANECKWSIADDTSDGPRMFGRCTRKFIKYGIENTKNFPNYSLRFESVHEIAGSMLFGWRSLFAIFGHTRTRPYAKTQWCVSFSLFHRLCMQWRCILEYFRVWRLIFISRGIRMRIIDVIVSGANLLGHLGLRRNLIFKRISDRKNAFWPVSRELS